MKRVCSPLQRREEQEQTIDLLYSVRTPSITNTAPTDVIHDCSSYRFSSWTVHIMMKLLSLYSDLCITGKRTM